MRYWSLTGKFARGFASNWQTGEVERLDERRKDPTRMSSYRFECSRKRKGLTFQLLKSIVDIPRLLQSATVFRIRSGEKLHGNY